MSDLISRQAAIRWVKTECNPYGKPTLDFESGKKVIEHLKQLPSEQPERKMGKWIVLDECSNEGVYCSECHKKVLKIDYSNTMKCKNFKFCPNCGADMRGEQDE